MASHARSLIAGVAIAMALVVLADRSGRALASARIARVAVFPVENVSGASVPAAEIAQVVTRRLTARGLTILDEEALAPFMARHRVRYAGGIDAATGEALKRETGVDAVLFVSVELASDAVPPKVAIIARLVSLAGVPTLVWADDVGLAGDDAPGLFSLGLVNDYRKLQASALDRLSRSLEDYLETGAVARHVKRASKFRPRTVYRALALDQDAPSSVAVLPFFNLSERRNAGEIVSLLFMRHLSSFREFHIVDSGVVRRQLLDARVIMEGGVSIADADTVAALIDADFVLGGRVLRYDDYEGAGGTPNVDFSTIIIDRKSRKVVWSSQSYNDGKDGVGFFEHGTSRTAHAMATQMVRLTAEKILGPRRQQRTDTH